MDLNSGPGGQINKVYYETGSFKPKQLANLQSYIDEEEEAADEARLAFISESKQLKGI